MIPVDKSFSDHDSCTACINLPCDFRSVYKRKIWLYKRADFRMFNNLISNYNWNDLFINCNSVDIACERFTDIFLDFANSCIPSKVVTIRPNDKPWMTSELRKHLRIRDRLHKIARSTKLLSDINKFKSQRNKVNNMKKHARLLFYENVHGIIEEFVSSDPKSYWRLIKRLLKSTGTSQSIPCLVDPHSNNVVTNDEDKASLLNDYFCNIKHVDESNTAVPVVESKTDKSFNSIRVNSNEIRDVLQILKLGKASGEDGISHHMLRNTSQTVCIPLEIIFNMSLSSGIFPANWKVAKVMPLFKKGDRHSPSNYRPISLLSTVGKVFERVIWKSL